MDTKETKKPGVEKEPVRKEVGAETEREEGLEELLNEQSETVSSSVENLKVSGEKDIKAVEKIGDGEDVGEMKQGVEKIGQKAEEAKDVYEKEATDTQRVSKTEKEIMEDVGKINDKIDEAIRKGLHKKEEELRKERERLLGLLGNKFDDAGTEAGQIGRKREQKAESKDERHIKETAKKQPEAIIKEETPVKTEDKATEAEGISEKASEEIKKILKDPTSKLSILVKAANFEEDYMLKLEKGLEKAKASKVDREERVRFYEKSIPEHKATLRKHTKRIKEIISEIEEKNKKAD